MDKHKENKKIDCQHFSQCSGCFLNDASFPPIFLEAQNFFSKQGIDHLKLISGPATGWRTRAKLAVRGTVEKPIIGLFKEGTHEVMDIPFCAVHHPQINEAVEKVRQFIRDKKIEPYIEETGQGLVRYLQLVVERTTGKIQLVFILNQSKEENLNKWDLNDPHFWHSIWINFNTIRTNTILGSQWTCVTGPRFIWERLCGTEVCFHPASFAQANLELFEKMLCTIKTHVPEKAKIAEFYAGVGVIGLTLVSPERQIKCCEITPQAKECFLEARKKLATPLATNIEFYEGLAIDHIDLLDEVEIVIVDPPRKGLDRKLLNALKEDIQLKKLIYVSCGWKSFQRDCEELLESGWFLSHAETFLFFPGTDHLEVLAIFAKKGA